MKYFAWLAACNFLLPVFSSHIIFTLLLSLLFLSPVSIPSTSFPLSIPLQFLLFPIYGRRNRVRRVEKVMYLSHTDFLTGKYLALTQKEVNSVQFGYLHINLATAVEHWKTELINCTNDEDNESSTRKHK